MYEVKNYDNVLGIEGLSDELLKNHFTLYEGYVKNINKLNDDLTVIEKEGKFDTLKYAELNRRFGWEWNGMRLHEIYFDSIGKNPTPINENSEFSKAITREFGSFENFARDFKNLAAIRGIGWVILYYDKGAERLFNVWVSEHNNGHLAGAKLLLPIDVFEHAYIHITR